MSKVTLKISSSDTNSLGEVFGVSTRERVNELTDKVSEIVYKFITDQVETDSDSYTTSQYLEPILALAETDGEFLFLLYKASLVELKVRANVEHGFMEKAFGDLGKPE